MTTLKVWNGTDWEYLTGGAAILQQDAEPGTPVEGDLWIDTDEVAQSGSTVRGALPSGYAQVTANQTGITTAEVDLTSLTVTVTVNSGERIRIHGHIAAWGTTAGTPNVAVLRIKEGATVLNEGGDVPNNSGISCDAFAILTPSAGSHTYKLAGITDTGTVQMVASATRPAFILVEGIGT